MGFVMANVEHVTLTAELRDACGTRESRRLRRDGEVAPAVIYSKSEDAPVVASNISISALEFKREYIKKHIIGRLFNLQIKGEKKSKLVVLYDFSLHSVTGALEHAEFYEVPKTGTMLAKVPVVFVNHENCLPVKRGGFLNVLRRTLTIECNVKDYPQKICVDLKNAEIGQIYRVKDLPLPDGCKVRRCTSHTLIAKFIGKKATPGAQQAANEETPAKK